MTTCCYFHPDRPATHTDSVVDLDPPRQYYGAADGRGYSSDTSYKRVGICTMCAMERSAQSTSRVEPINQETEDNDGRDGRDDLDDRDPMQIAAERCPPRE